MKRHGQLWDKITHPDNILQAYKRARRGKGWRRAVKQFEKNLEANLLNIQRMLCAGTFKTSKYKSKTVYEPKKREIYILPFYPDRIIQHALLQVLIPIWDNLMIYDSFACRDGKGMHDASKRTMAHVRNYKYCLKADISKFYPSIDQEVLIGIVERKIKCVPTLQLLENIIRSFPGGKNTPIGNYTSQWFGNLYMNELDTAIKQEKGVKAYLRYCDDFVVFSNSKTELLQLHTWVQQFISSKLLLKFSKSSVFPVTQGVDFLGYRHFPDKVLLRKGTSKRVIKRISKLPNLLFWGKITKEQFRSSLASTEGWLKWANTFNLRHSIGLTELKGLLNARVP